MCFGVLKRIVSLRRFFEYTQQLFWLRTKKTQLRTRIWLPVIIHTEQK